MQQTRSGSEHHLSTRRQPQRQVVTLPGYNHSRRVSVSLNYSSLVVLRDMSISPLLTPNRAWKASQHQHATSCRDVRRRSARCRCGFSSCASTCLAELVQSSVVTQPMLVTQKDILVMETMLALSAARSTSDSRHMLHLDKLPRSHGLRDGLHGTAK